MALLTNEKNIFTAIPPSINEKKDGQLTDEQIKQFFEDVKKYFFLFILRACYSQFLFLRLK